MGYRQDATELGDARRRVEALVSELPGAEQRPFEHPWELRAFAMAVAAFGYFPSVCAGRRRLPPSVLADLKPDEPTDRSVESATPAAPQVPRMLDRRPLSSTDARRERAIALGVSLLRHGW